MVLGDSSHDFKVQILCRNSERGITEPIFGQNNKSRSLCKINSHTRSLYNDFKKLRVFHNDITTHAANSYIYIYIYICVCACVCVCALANDSGKRVISTELRPTHSQDLKEQWHFSVYINVIPLSWGWRWKDRPKRRCRPKTIHDFKSLRLPSEVLLKLTET